ncbi:unnamed protein product [Cladocopium goreaui]|uniref:Uncharacterized protein n=1 Tax=Cladocopium goreaui TaxID=2562237 RepID=A0A9P1DRB6_9DINO|nr:unnamed protein product [Cladocopium goreaui]
MLTPWTLLPFALAFLDEVEDGPPQMTSDWWDLHYVETLEDIDLTVDPREARATAGLEGGSLADEGLLDAAVDCIGEAFLNHSRRPKVLVLGCGLSPLVYVLADTFPHVTAGCMELSPTLLESLEAMALPLPRPPKFFVQADITALRRRRGKDSQVLKPGSFDVLVDENVLDGMACRFPASKGLASLREALDGIAWLLKPHGRLITISFAPLTEGPYLEAFEDWALMPPCALQRDTIHVATWTKMQRKRT